MRPSRSARTWAALVALIRPERLAEGAAIGRSMRELGVHQGLAPVLDVIRDPRWGRVEECISEDPYLVGEVGAAYVRGLQSAGVHATLKHFVGYSGSQAGRNFAPVHAGTREECLARLKRALSEFVVEGIETTLPLFRELVDNGDIRRGAYDIHWLEHFLAEGEPGA